jgi:putative restriction endonuclease
VRYWWVNHDRTVRHDIDGGYLWSPRGGTGDARHRFGDTVRLAAPGDAILSCAEGRVGHVGLISGPALDEHGAGREEGWWLPVAWTDLPEPFLPEARIAEVRPWLPYRHSPLAPATGREAGTARLSEIGEALFELVIAESGAGDWREWLAAEAETDDDADPGHLADTRLGYDPALAASVRDQMVKARRGQGLFRFRVFQIEAACRLTGIARPDLLIASHIKPWRLCETTHERLDGANGLLLTPHVDRLFDRGLISFSDNGEVLRARSLAREDVSRLGLSEACMRNAGAFSAAQQAYLACHRALVFDLGSR